MVEADAGRQAEEARKHALTQPGHGARPMALQGKRVLGGPEDRLDALADRRQMGTLTGLVCAPRPHDGGAQGGRTCGEGPAGIALVADEQLAAAPVATLKQNQREWAAQ